MADIDDNGWLGDDVWTVVDRMVGDSDDWAVWIINETEENTNDG